MLTEWMAEWVSEAIWTFGRKILLFALPEIEVQLLEYPACILVSVGSVLSANFLNLTEKKTDVCIRFIPLYSF